MMTNKAHTFENFKEWLYQQPKGKDIDNSFWHTCAIGEWLELTEDDFIACGLFIHDPSLEDELGYMLEHLLGGGFPRLLVYRLADGLFDTYRDLIDYVAATEWLDDSEEDIYDAVYGNQRERLKLKR